ncbi:Serine or threonine protein kinase [Streptomyces venezuelae]|uniref:protein kinase family protein n=1 Tax=Streptomyces gardneri TaxID=66892 RepID=UPI0006BD9B08|nr:protein kinase family protein [Streptomyces gardneri]ALO09681.1 Serine or threonine protein kinase [Streptomyces venezuelae]QPK46754.1 serine/threonine protein kinase [Streptomyces gardneri]WRK38154.1 protein kinase family protein [Streptomyces venezuelae]CUM39886.1 Serine/threonine protein kinase [Streptomyces venezuelae]
MAERSTAAVDVADSGDDPLTAKADKAATDGVATTQKMAEKSAEPTGSKAVERQSGEQPSITAPELHSGHKLARRYRLEECVTRLDGFSSWRAVDEKLRRAVGVHLLPADHPRARSVLAAARSAALLGDPRFVQVLDAVEENDLVYVVHEWLPDSTELTALLATGPMEAHDAYQLVSQVSQAMAAAHREGLAHLRLTPSAVLRSSTGQYRIRGLAVNAALRGITAERPQRTDTEAIGALLYAALTQRWPYDSDAYGLSGLPKGVGLLSPDQVRAGVHRGLAEIAMRALANDGATASRQDRPCTTPDELAKAVAAMPRVKPPEPTFATPPDYQRTTYQQGTYGRPQARPVAAPQPVIPPPAPLQSRTGTALKWAVSALLIAALGLGSWQIADRLLAPESTTKSPVPTPTVDEKPEPPKPISIASAQDFDPPPKGSGGENPQAIQLAYDGDPNTYWHTVNYFGSDFANLKPGVGMVLDLGTAKEISSVELSFVGQTSVELRTAPSDASSAPSTADEFTTQAEGSGSNVTLKPTKPITTRYVLVWLTELPANDGGFRGKLSEIKILG